MNFASPFSLSLVAITILAFLGLPIGHSMIAGSVLYLLLAGQDMGTVAEQLLNGMYSNYVILSVPLFILAAEFMNIGSMTDRLMAFCNALVGRFRGGLAHVNVLQSIIFAGMSGSAIADAAGTGRMMQVMMTRDGRYTPSYAAAVTAVSSVIGPIIPPSIPMVLYALVSDASIGFLFLGGVIPGLLMALSQMIIIATTARRKNFPVEKPVPLRKLPRITWNAFPSLMMPVVLLGGIYSGVMTPTEAAAVAAAYALIISAGLYRSVSWGDFYRSVAVSARTTASIGMLIAGSLVFNYVVTVENIPEGVKNSTVPLGPLAVWVSDHGECAPAFAGVRSGRDGDSPHRRAGVHSDGASVGYRSRPLRCRRRRQHHDRTDHAAVWAPPVHHGEHLGRTARKDRP